MRFPQQVCFRVTRACNARCGFCLAPWNGDHPREDVLNERIDWLLRNGVKTLDFCGGEPTIHPALPRLIEGHLVADVVALIGSIDIVLGEVDR